MQPLLKAFIFDLDGTLLNTLDDIADSCNHVLQKNGYATRTAGEIRLMIGDGLRKLMERASGVAEPDKLSLLHKEMREYYQAHLDEKTRPYPGVGDLLGRLAGLGFPLAVLSNKAHPFSRSLVRRFFPDIPFQAVEGQREGFPPKPDPAGVLRITGIFGQAPAEIGLVGDSRVDMLTAVNSGAFPIGVTWGFRDRDELLAHGAKILLDRPEEFPAKVLAS